ncbi:MAG TPA: UvrD-helicase domain-containing protein, partial [Anaerolineae bacterium]|nr:UvrD-helicase domain-containing protein [Anaerolineae bacterium]
MDLLSQLNPSQAQAVQAIEGPVLVLAGPGSGKTRVLTHRIAYLVKQCQMDPYNLMAVTFTNKAAREMRERLAKLIGQTNLDRLTVGTFHAICARILRREAQAIGMRTDFVIYDRDDQLSLLKSALRELNLDEKMYRPPAIQAAISRAKRSLLAPGEYNPPTYWDEVVSRVYERYQKLLQQNSAVDFDDLMMLTTRMFEQHKQILHKYQQRYIQVLVDEFQDTDSAQYMLVRQLTAVRKNLFVVGDEDQSIYGWRGADYRNIQRFRQDFPAAQVILLEQNYRSTQNILDAARHVIALNRQRTDKRLWTQNDSGMPVTVYEAYDEQEEAEYVVREIESLARLKTCRYRDCAVMYRTNAQSRVIEDAFVRHGLPYKLVGATRFYERREIKDVLAYLRLTHNPHDDVSLQRVLNVPPRGIGQRTQETLQQFASQHSLPLYAAMQLLQAAQVARPGAKQGEDEEDRGDPQPSPPVDGRAAKALLSLLAMLDKLLTAREKSDPVQLIDLLLTESGYKDLILDGTDEGQERWENVQELRTVASKYKDQPPEEGLTAFLEDVALVSDVDNLTEEG